MHAPGAASGVGVEVLGMGLSVVYKAKNALIAFRNSERSMPPEPSVSKAMKISFSIDIASCVSLLEA